jgi:hypothetical protein
MSGEITFIPNGSKNHADELTKDFVSKIENARTRLNADAKIENGDFSITGNAASLAYPRALQFAFEDLATHEQMLGEHATNIECAARLSQGAAEHSTVKQV